MFVFSTLLFEFQILCHLLGIYVHELSTSDPETQALKCLFRELQNSGIVVRTAKYLQVLHLNGYMPCQKYHAQKCLIQLLQKFYPAINNDCIFKISLLESTMFEGNWT